MSEINHTEIAKQARNLGSIARMNHQKRVPLHDKKLIEIIGEMTMAQMIMHMKEWSRGYDDMALEYANAQLQIESNQKS
jgi:hypothetical protein